MAWPVTGSLTLSLRTLAPSSHSCLVGLAAPGIGQMKSSELCHLRFLSQHALPPAMWVSHSLLQAGLYSSVISEGVPLATLF